MLLRVSSYKQSLVKYQINKLSTYKVKKDAALQVGAAISFMLSLVQFFFLHIKIGIKIIITQN